MEACQSLVTEFLNYNGKRVPEYLELMSKIVSKYRGNSLQLCSPAKAILTIGPIEDTEYKNRPAVVNGWGKFYLPTTATMEVIGYVEGTPYPCDKLVLMTCQDQKVYVYDEDELHLVASSLKEMCTKGIAFPPFQSYYHGEAFKDMTKEDWEEVKKGPVGKRLDEEHRKLVASHKSTLLQDLKIIRQKQRCHQQYSSSLPNNILTQSQKGRT